MDEAVSPTPVVPTPFVPSSGPGKAFALLGKVLIGLVVIVLLVFGGYYLSTRFAKKSGLTQPSAPKPTTLTPAQDAAAVQQQIATTTLKLVRKATAGKTGGVFTKYTATVNPGWVDSLDTSTGNRLTLTRGDYQIIISQAAGGTGACTFASYVEFSGISTRLRRGANINGSFTVCEKKSGAFSFPTEFGYITYLAPNSPDTKTLSEMDSMVASLTK